MDPSLEEESFVILGSSPYPSLCPDGNSLLQDALDIGDAVDKIGVVPRDPPVYTEADGTEPGSLTQLSVSSSQQKTNTNSSTSNLPAAVEASSTSEPKSLAASFILGEVNSGVLKNSVYSQFPSFCSMEACAEDVVKLQNMLTEHVALKQTLFKVNHTMEDYYKITQQWRKEAASRELRYQEQANALQEQLSQLKEENKQLKDELASKLSEIHMVEDIRYKEQQELRQSVSEKTSLIQNMRFEIDKLQQQQLHSFDFVPDHKIEAEKGTEPDQNHVFLNDKHEIKIKELEREMSKLMAENLEVKDMQTVYIDEISCLKVNLTSAEELIIKLQHDIQELKANDAQKQEQIAHLQTQNEIYRKDFEMERADREKNAGEKEQYLLDLRSLQRRNQELIEALSTAHKNDKSVGSPASSISSPSNLRDNQRPVLDPTRDAAQTARHALRCPICSKSSYDLTVLQSHVNDCLDKN